MRSIDPRGFAVRSHIRRSKEPPRCLVTCICEINASELQLPVVCSSFACELSVERTDRGSPAISCVLLLYRCAIGGDWKMRGGHWPRLSSALGGCNRLAYASISRRKCTLPGASPAMMVSPPGDMAQVWRGPSQLKNVMICPLSISHTRRVLSIDPKIACFPSGVIATAMTLPVGPLSVCISSALSISHTLKVLSIDPEIACFPYGVTATA